MKLFYVVTGAIGLLFSIPASSAPARTFKAGKLSLSGTPKEICVLEGAWADGEYLRYEAWDSCEKLQVRSVDATKLDRTRQPGQKGRAPSVADIPAGAEVLEVRNAFSAVLLFRDQGGDLQEILYAD